MSDSDNDAASRRIFRTIDLSQIDPSVVRQLISDYDGLLATVVQRITAGWSLPPCIDYEDLRSVAQVALCEAYLTYCETRRMSLSTWIYRVAHWRVAAQLEYVFEGFGPIRAVSLDEPRSSDGDRVYTLYDAIETGLPDPEEVVSEVHRRAWVYDQVQQLDMREALVVSAALKGESAASVARSLGLTRQRLSVHKVEALDKLRRSHRRRNRLANPPLTPER